MNAGMPRSAGGRICLGRIRKCMILWSLSMPWGPSRGASLAISSVSMFGMACAGREMKHLSIVDSDMVANVLCVVDSVVISIRSLKMLRKKTGWYWYRWAAAMSESTGELRLLGGNSDTLKSPSRTRSRS
eukprot:7801870-Pyramimonas_sp.AAC.1